MRGYSVMNTIHTSLEFRVAVFDVLSDCNYQSRNLAFNRKIHQPRCQNCDSLGIRGKFLYRQYCAKVMQTIIDENRDNRELSAIFERYFD